jgi:Phospholipase_D-nuclease N-terminal/Short C-terminal domain
MVLAETFWQVIWTMFIFFLWIIWIWLLIVVFMDLFRNHQSSGWAKAGWCIFIILLPFLGVFVYLIAEGKGMAERKQQDIQAAQAGFDAQVRAAAGSSDPAAQIANAKQLLDSGAITQAEFDQIKAKALA